MLRVPAGGDLVQVLEDLAESAEARDGAPFDRIADLARQLADALAAVRPDAEVMVAHAREAILGAIHDAHQPLREAVLYERVRGRGADLSPAHFQAVAEDLVVRGEIRVAVDHEGPARDPAPFEPRFYRPRD